MSQHHYLHGNRLVRRCSGVKQRGPQRSGCLHEFAELLGIDRTAMMLPVTNDANHVAARAAELQRKIDELTMQLAELRTELQSVTQQLAQAALAAQLQVTAATPGTSTERKASAESKAAAVNRLSSPADKIALFRRLFTGRDDAYAVRWTSARTGRSGWSPAVRGGFYTEAMTDADLLPLDDAAIERHLIGTTPEGREFHAGLYPLRTDDTCRLLVCDFDGGAWRGDAAAYAAACQAQGVPVAVEISRSGEGAHVWIFFEAAVATAAARSLGAALLRRAMSARGAMKLDSYDRFFPAQDLLPRRSPGRMRLGNLIALPLQGNCRKRGTTVFADPATWEPFDDQFAFLSSVRSLPVAELDRLLGTLRRVEAGPAREVRPQRKLLAAAAASAVPAGSVTLRLGASVAVPLAGVPASVIAELKHAASVANPEFFRRQAQRFSTFGTPRYVRCFEHDEGELRLPRGLLAQAQAALEDAGITVSVTSEIPAPAAIDVAFRGELRLEQLEAVENMLVHETGVLVAPPGAGKTVMACAVIARRRVSTAIIVNRAELIAQWRERLVEFLDIEGRQLGQLGDGRRKRRGLIDIIMLQSVSHRNADPALLGEYGQIIIDECHAIAAPSAEAAIRQVAAPFWLGLTATPYRADQMDELITMQCGPVRHEITDAEAPPLAKRLIVHETAFTTEERGDDGASIQAIYSELAVHAERNAAVVADIVSAWRAGRSCLVLSNRVEHVGALAEALRGCISAVHVLHGRMSRRERTETLELIAAAGDSPFVLVAIDRIAGEGLDLPALDTLFLTVPVSFRGRIIQQLGRITRTTQQRDLTPEVHDYHDQLVPLLDRMQRKRRRVIERQGFEVAGGSAQ